MAVGTHNQCTNADTIVHMRFCNYQYLFHIITPHRDVYAVPGFSARLHQWGQTSGRGSAVEEFDPDTVMASFPHKWGRRGTRSIGSLPCDIQIKWFICIIGPPPSACPDLFLKMHDRVPIVYV